MAVQIPLQSHSQVNAIINETVHNEKWKSKFPQKRIFNILVPEEYYDILTKLSSDIRIWETHYYHELSSPEDILEWYRGAGLRPYLAQLKDSDKPEFETDILERIKRDFPIRSSGKVILKFSRLFFTARR